MEKPIRIIVLDRGFVYIGNVAIIDGDWLLIENAWNIRHWGTTRGLGELVDGPTRNTVLDAVGTVRAPLRAVIHLIDVREDAWAKRLAS